MMPQFSKLNLQKMQLKYFNSDYSNSIRSLNFSVRMIARKMDKVTFVLP